MQKDKKRGLNIANGEFPIFVAMPFITVAMEHNKKESRPLESVAVATNFVVVVTRYIILL